MKPTAAPALPRLAALLLLGSACYPRLEIVVPSGDLGTADDTGGGDGGGGDGGTVAPFGLDSVTPTDGPTSGEASIELLGGPFPSMPTVRFGDVSAEVQEVQSDRLTVLSPPVSSPGLVDVSVSQGSQSAVLPDAYHYWADADEGALIVGAWLQLSVANATTWTGAAPTFDAWLRFIQPGDVWPTERYGVALDTCGAIEDPLSSLQGPEELLLGYSDFMLSLTWSETRQEYAYQATSQPDPQFDSPLLLEATRSDLSPPLNLPEVARTPDLIELISPDLRGGDVPELDYDAATVTWEAGGFGHVMVFVGSSGTASFMCLASDDGDITIPSSRFDDFAWTESGGKRYADIWLAVLGVTSKQTTLAWTNGVARFDAGLGQIGRVRIVDDGARVAP